ncbi:hypothetical protein [Halostagnicola sp. A-GB9-2]|uniref:DUF7312 domain-containing protein n=1 Tax=Halostagnicola sp. A-GB9-2 TaxID=3048066 RepID=UPI0024BF406B|nr:hypothetical protein [Halostagnicola sp. A-GB9-2]MDJ1431093.1 hypothetical protein [Halostagnicola sp. A-GB9-2]
MTEDPSGPKSDDEPAGGNGDEEGGVSSRDETNPERDPFDETFIVKEAEETDSQAETEDESSTVGNSWLDESPIEEADSTGERISDERRNDRTSGSGDEQSDEDWGRIPIDLGREDDGAAESPDADAESVDEDDPHRPEPSSTPVVPGDPSLEGAVFVVLGAVAMILVMFRLASVMIA